MAVSIAVPTGVMVLLGRTDLVIYAAFGAFTGMYGRGAARNVRMRHQLGAGAILVTGVLLGACLSQGRFPTSVLVTSEAAFAAAASLLADRIGFRPAGPFFGLFAFGACASLPPDDGLGESVMACLAAALFALALGAVMARKAAPGPETSHRGRHQPPWAVGRRAHEYALAILLAGGASVALDIGHPHWAMASAAVLLSAENLTGRLGRGMHRILGTLAGLGLSALIFATDPAPLVMALLVVCLQFPTELFIARHYGVALFFFTPLILLMTQLASPVPVDSLLRDRAVETIVGVLIGAAVVLVGDALQPSSRKRKS
jgi:Fusaric acid resistance protein-like